MTKIVIDTNVFISAVLFGKQPWKILSLCQAGEFQLLMSKNIITEYTRVLAYPKFKLTHEEINYILKKELIPYISPIKVKSEFEIIKDDPSDNMFLSLAHDGKGQYIISGDKHLLELKSFHKIQILTVSDFLNI